MNTHTIKQNLMRYCHLRHAACCGILVLLATTGFACGSKNDPGDNCPSLIEIGPVTYTADIAPLMDTHCTACHAPGADRRSAPTDTDLHNLSNVISHAERSNIRIAAQTMPPSGIDDAPAMSQEDRCRFFAWVSNGTPE